MDSDERAFYVEEMKGGDLADRREAAQTLEGESDLSPSELVLVKVLLGKAEGLLPLTEDKASSLIGLFGDRDAKVRDTAVAFLASCGDTKAMKVLSQRIDSLGRRGKMGSINRNEGACKFRQC